MAHYWGIQRQGILTETSHSLRAQFRVSDVGVEGVQERADNVGRGIVEEGWKMQALPHGFLGPHLQEARPCFFSAALLKARRSNLSGYPLDLNRPISFSASPRKSLSLEQILRIRNNWAKGKEAFKWWGWHEIQWTNWCPLVGLRYKDVTILPFSRLILTSSLERFTLSSLFLKYSIGTCGFLHKQEEKERHCWLAQEHDT